MTTPQESIIVDSCQYTPVYLIQNPGAIQGRSFVVTQNNVEEPKPVSDNLKRFYESSGLLENNLVNNVSNVTKPRILKKAESKLVGNNLKLASFLLPKIENTPRQYIAVNNVVLKTAPAPAPPPAPPVINTTVPRVEVDRKIVKMKSIPTRVKATPERVVQVFPERIVKTTPERTLPKTRPKENIPSPKQSKHTSVQLLKLGETYHSLNQLNDDQMKMVNQALKIFSNPETPTEPTYDPVTNTRFIYKVVSPRDLTVVGKNKIVFKQKKKEIKEVEKEEPEPPPDEVKVTRSGRKVKFPKQIVSEDPQKPRKKRGTVVSCFQCSMDFCSLYRLQKHYESHPTHIPAKIHSNLFHCLLAIIKSGSEEDRANMFIQQLEQLIEKLKSLLPCLLKKIDGSENSSCDINDDIGKLFGMNPGKYNLNMDALACIKDKDGYCCHNPPPKPVVSDLTNPSQPWLTKHEEAADDENEDCARINAVDKWPTANKRLWKIKKKKENIKRMRLASENAENAVIELGVEDLITFADKNDNATELPDLSAINISKPAINIPKPIVNIPKPTVNISKPTVNIPKPTVNVPKPTVNISKPTVNIPKPTVNISKPTVNIPKPIVNITKPKINILQSKSNIPQPKTNTTQPKTNITQPEISISQPSINISQAAVNISQPVKMEASMPIIPTEVIDDDVPTIVEPNNGICQIDNIKQTKLPHLQFHSTHFDIRSSPIKPSATVFCKFQIDSEKIARYEAQAIRPLDLDQEQTKVSVNNSIHMDTIQINHLQSDPLHGNHIQPDSLHTNNIQSDSLHTNHIQPDSLHTNHLQSNSLHTNHIIQSDSLQINHIQTDPMHTNQLQSDPMHTNHLQSDSMHTNHLQSDSMHTNHLSDSMHRNHLQSDSMHSNHLQSDPMHTNHLQSNHMHTNHLQSDTIQSDVDSVDVDSVDLQSILQDEMINLSCKDNVSHDLSFEAKDFFMNSDSEKSSDNFLKSNGLIEPSLIHVKDTVDKLPMNEIDHGLENDSDSRLLNQGQSVLNFLDSLGSDCLSYPETDIRNTNVDFQLDLFSFHNS